jgi:hypothetical protein
MMSGPPMLMMEGKRGGVFGSIDKPLPFGKARPSSLPAPHNIDIFSVKNEWCGSSTPSTWDVTGESLEMVPWSFPLERTHREILADAAAVAARISNVLRTLSVEAEFCSEKAKVKCKTADYVCFRIRLFSGGESGQPVVVEVQKRSGSSSSFMTTCRAILDAAEGKEFQATKEKKAHLISTSIGSMSCLASVVTQRQDFETESASALEGVLCMIRSEKRDSHILGLENLCALMDPVRTTPAIALRVSKSILLVDENREEIRLLTDHDIFTSDFDLDSTQMAHADHLRHLALRAFATSLEVCSKDGCLTDALTSQKWFADCLIPSLVDELKRVETNANNAYHAASCIHSMVACAPGFVHSLSQNGGIVAVEKAHEYGRTRHELLAHETQLCLKCVHGLS